MWISQKNSDRPYIVSIEPFYLLFHKRSQEHIILSLIQSDYVHGKLIDLNCRTQFFFNVRPLYDVLIGNINILNNLNIHKYHSI